MNRTWLNDYWLIGVSDATMLVNGIDQMGQSSELKELRRNHARKESSNPAWTALRAAFFEQ